MKQNKKLGIALSLAMALILVTTLLFFNFSSSGSEQVIEAKKIKILKCLDNNITGYIQLPAIKICIDNALSGDQSIEDAITSNAAFSRAQDTNPLTFTFCHKNMHDLAHKVPSDQVLKVLNMAHWNTCEWGFVHGLLEDAAVGNMSKFFKPIVEICSTWKDYKDRSECAHSVGHGGWNSSKDMSKSIDLCRGFIEYADKQMCTYGLFMQIYWATSGIPSEKFDRNPSIVINSCEQLSGEARQLCVEASTMTYRLYYNKKLIKIRDFLPLSLNEEKRLPESILKKITFYSEQAKKICLIFKDEDKPTCNRVVWETGVDIDGPALNRSDVTEAICSAYPENYQDCVTLAKKTKNYWASRNVYTF